ncbi:MAG: type II and III secretion system protein, partial [Bdellovibrionales bacterium]|nr:type II and III secretion system protein [Bdellovibrionales bacterium]
MKNLKPINVILFLALFNLNALGREFILAIGASQSLPLIGHSVWIEKKRIIQGIVSNNRLIITGKNTGSSYLKIKDQLYKFQVVNPQSVHLVKKINNLLNKKIGLKVITRNSRIQITGTLYKFSDWLDVAKIISTEEEYDFKASLSSSLQEEADSYFNKLFADSGLPEQKIQIRNHPILRIHPNDIHLKEYKTILHPYGVQVITDASVLRLSPVIKVQITVAEINRGFAQNYGIDFSDSYKAELLPTPKMVDFEAKLHFLETSGKGKLLASPNIICKSGKQAEFLAGGEFPIKTHSKYGSTIIWKKYGVMLKVKPKADAIGRMSIGIESEISSIDKSLSIDDVPAISTNKVSSYFDLTSSRIIALSGLLTDIQTDGYRGIPFLSRLPIIGSLFSSSDFLSKRTELMIFVKPSIMKMTPDYKPNLNELSHLEGL